MNDTELLHRIYYIEKNYDGVENLYKKAKIRHPNIRKEFIKEWLEQQQTHQTTTTKITKKSFLPIYSEIPFSFQIDLTFITKYKNQNSGYHIIFTAINVNTRFVYAYKLKSSTDDDVLNCLKTMHSKTDINCLTGDLGKEFINKKFSKYCDDNEIRTYFFKADSHKLGIINRFHRTLKEKFTKYFNSVDTVRWVDVLDEIISNYNNTVHSSTHSKPIEMNDYLEHIYIEEKQEETNNMTSKEQNFDINDKVRIRIERQTIGNDKFTPNFTTKIYNVIKVKVNSLIVEDDKKISYNVKKSNAKLIHHVDNTHDNVNKNIADTEHKSHLQFQKSGLDKNNIIENSKRESKTKQLKDYY